MIKITQAQYVQQKILRLYFSDNSWGDYDLQPLIARQTELVIPLNNELLSIVEYGAYYPIINTTVFPNTIDDSFWSSSSVANYTSDAWVVDFGYGSDIFDPKDFDNAVRLVRSGQLIPYSLDLTTTLTASTDRVKLKQNLTYTATLTNQGTGPATNATLVFYFPLRWTHYVIVPSDCISNGRSYRCSVANLAAGASLTKSITVSYAQRGALNIIGLGITDSDDAEASNNKAQVMTTITP